MTPTSAWRIDHGLSAERFAVRAVPYELMTDFARQLGQALAPADVPGRIAEAACRPFGRLHRANDGDAARGDSGADLWAVREQLAALGGAGADIGTSGPRSWREPM